MNIKLGFILLVLVVAIGFADTVAAQQISSVQTAAQASEQVVTVPGASIAESNVDILSKAQFTGVSPLKQV